MSRRSRDSAEETTAKRSKVVDTANAEAPGSSKVPTTNAESGRYKWLADICDANRNKPGDPSYDAQTLFIPAKAFDALSAIDKQYW